MALSHRIHLQNLATRVSMPNFGMMIELVSPVQTIQPAVLLVNSRARSGEESFRKARETLAGLRVPLVASHAITRPETFRNAIRECIGAGARRVIVGGGDGTVSCASDVLAGSGIALGVLPLGTANDFARSLGIPMNLEDACGVIADGEHTEIDLGLAGKRHFLNAASIGISSAITRRMTAGLKRRAGRLAYPAAAAIEASRFKPFRVRLQVGGRMIALEAFQVVIGNGRFHGAGQMVGPNASLQDKLLDVYVIASEPVADPAAKARVFRRTRQLMSLARVASMLRSGEHVQHPAVAHQRTREVVVESIPTRSVDVDGELLGATPMTFKVVPGALRVIVPRGNAGPR